MKKPYVYRLSRLWLKLTFFKDYLHVRHSWCGRVYDEYEIPYPRLQRLLKVTVSRHPKIGDWPVRRRWFGISVGCKRFTPHMIAHIQKHIPKT